MNFRRKTDFILFCLLSNSNYLIQNPLMSFRGSPARGGFSSRGGDRGGSRGGFSSRGGDRGKKKTFFFFFFFYTIFFLHHTFPEFEV